LIFFCATGPAGATAASVLTLTGDQDNLHIGSHLQIFQDVHKKLSFEEIKALDDAAWKRSESSIPTFGFTASRYWMRFTVMNAAGAGLQRIMEAEYSHYDVVTFYLVTGEQVLKHQMGDLQPFSKRLVDYRNFLVPFDLAQGQQMTVYVEVETSGPLFIPINIWNPASFGAAKTRADHVAGYYYGILLGMFGYNLFLFLTTKKRSYLYYVLYLAGFFFFQYSLHGFAFHFLWPFAPWWANNCVAFFLAFALLWVTVFTTDFLETRTYTPYLHKAMLGIMAVSALTAVLSLVSSYSIAIRAGTVLALIGASLFLAAGLICLRKDFRPAKFYVFAFTAFLIGIIMNSLKQLGVIEQGFFSEYSIQIGSAIEMVLLSLALGDKIRFEQKLAHERISNLNIDLEKKVEEVKGLNDEILEKERARTAFFHNTSHELRTPLNGIIGYVTLIAGGHYGKLSVQQSFQLQKIGTLAKSLLHQVNTILDLAKSKKKQLDLQYSKINLKSFVMEMDLLCEGLKQKHPHCSYALRMSWLENESPHFVTDYDKLTVVVRNLLANAFKFSHPDKANNVSIEFAIDDMKALKILIKDTGIGIPADKLEQIFEEFYQVDSDSRRLYEGTGLGLAMVKQFVGLLGATVTVESVLEEGSVFSLVIPQGEVIDVPFHVQNAANLHDIYMGPSILVEEEQKASATFSRSGGLTGRVYVIDDNKINCDVITEMLRSKGIDATYRMSGKEGLELIRERKPDLLLLDLMMPEMSGEDVLRDIRQSPGLQDLPVIIITARASEEDRLFALSLGADDYLSKPILPDELILRVKNIIERNQLLRHGR
jgi:signal transduction histidine kinase/CheY-like chemotaxis protein